MVHLRGLQQQLVVGEELGVEDKEYCLETMVELKHCEADVTEVQCQLQDHAWGRRGDGGEPVGVSIPPTDSIESVTLATSSKSSRNDPPELEA